jgi:hypothetical protein
MSERGLKYLRIKSTALCGVVCVLLTFAASFLALSEWHFKEARFTVLQFNLMAAVMVPGYVVFYVNLAINVFNTERHRQRELLIKVLLISYFVVQSLASIEILGLLFIAVGID